MPLLPSWLRRNSSGRAGRSPSGHPSGTGPRPMERKAPNSGHQTRSSHRFGSQSHGNEDLGPGDPDAFPLRPPDSRFRGSLRQGLSENARNDPASCREDYPHQTALRPRPGPRRLAGLRLFHGKNGLGRSRHRNSVELAIREADPGDLVVGAGSMYFIGEILRMHKTKTRLQRGA